MISGIAGNIYAILMKSRCRVHSIGSFTFDLFFKEYFAENRRSQ